jgi:hypothetical protein
MNTGLVFFYEKGAPRSSGSVVKPLRSVSYVDKDQRPQQRPNELAPDLTLDGR